MKKQVFNPYLPSYEYVPDGDPYVQKGKDGKYYFVYSSTNSHELCYAIGERPTGPFISVGVFNLRLR